MKIHTLQPTESLPPFITLGDCKKGETSAKTGCTPASGGGGKKEGEAPASEETGEETVIVVDSLGQKWTKPMSIEEAKQQKKMMTKMGKRGLSIKKVEKPKADSAEETGEESEKPATDGMSEDERAAAIDRKKKIREDPSVDYDSPDIPDYYRIDPDVMGDVAWRHRDTLSRVAESVEKGNDFDTESIGNLIKDLQGLQDQAEAGFKKSKEQSKAKGKRIQKEVPEDAYPYNRPDPSVPYRKN